MRSLIMAVAALICATAKSNEGANHTQCASTCTTVEAEAETGKKLIEWILSTDDLTELQWKNAFEPFRGKFASVRGIVKDVGIDYGMDKTFVVIKVAEIKSRLDKFFMRFILKPNAASKAASWNKGMQLCLRGKVFRQFPAQFPDGCVELRDAEEVSTSRDSTKDTTSGLCDHEQSAQKGVLKKESNLSNSNDRTQRAHLSDDEEEQKLWHELTQLIKKNCGAGADCEFVNELVKYTLNSMESSLSLLHSKKDRIAVLRGAIEQYKTLYKK